jgi:hypothetical protein
LYASDLSEDLKTHSTDFTPSGDGTGTYSKTDNNIRAKEFSELPEKNLDVEFYPKRDKFEPEGHQDELFITDDANVEIDPDENFESRMQYLMKCYPSDIPNPIK